MILGLDISTSCTGFCVVNESGEPVHFSNVDLTCEKNFFEKVRRVKSHMVGIMLEYPIRQIAVEDHLTSFKRGRSSSSTLFKLAKFNGIIQWLCYSDLDIEAYPINVNNARKINNIVVLSKKKTPVSTKDQVLVQVKEIIGESFVFPTKILKSGPRKGLEVNEKSAYDMADAFVIAKAMWVEKNKNKA